MKEQPSQRTAEGAAPARQPSRQDAQGAARGWAAPPLWQLQQSYGNRFVGRLIQAKLSVSRPGDAHEREADEVADHVMRMADVSAQTAPAIRPLSASALQRACAQCDEEVEQRARGEGEEERRLQAKSAGGAAKPAATTANINIPKGAGEPLTQSARAFFEPRFGRDFGHVRVHADSRAAESARSFSALAYTFGRDIVFDAGRYAPESAEGRRLLAHELTHVVQQGHAGTLAGDESGAAHVKEHAREGVISRQPATATAPATAPATAATTPPALNYENLAERIHRAISGPGTDEEQVYLALQQLQRDPLAIQQLERVYLNNYHVTLEADIRDDFSGEELEYALQLINRGTAGSAQAVGAAPSTPGDFEQAARRLWAAVDIWGTDEEAIYAVLLPLNRDMRLIHELMRVYESLYRENLRERIIDEMSSSELAYALYLLGGSAVRANVEIAEVTDAEATRLFNEMASLTFWTTDDRQAPVPYHYPPDGCYARAHMITQRLTELGYASERVFAITRVPSFLEVESALAGDVPGPAPAPSDRTICSEPGAGTQTNPTVRWMYHVAPIIHVRNPQGVVREMVIDPSLANRPLTIEQWMGLMRSSQFSRMTLGEIQQLAAAGGGNLPAGSKIAYTVDRDIFYPGMTEPRSEGAYEEMEAVRARMTEYAFRAGVHELAALMRLEMRNATIDVNRVITAIHNASSETRRRLGLCFPNMLFAFRGRLSAADVTRLDAEISRP